jgi:hypothetical protein
MWMSVVALPVESMQCASIHLEAMIVAARKDSLEIHFQYAKLLRRESVMIQQLASVVGMCHALQGMSILSISY